MLDRNRTRNKNRATEVPIIWERSELGFRIENLRNDHYPKVLSMIQENYIPNEFLLRSSEHDDTERYNNLCQKSVLERALQTMNYKSSLVLIDENKRDSIAGFILLSIVNKIDFGRIFSRTSLVSSKTHKNVIAIHTALHKKIDLYYEYKCETFMRFYMLHVQDRSGYFYLSAQLFKAAFDLARSLKIPLMCGIFSNWKIQKVALRLGFRMIHDISYDSWLDEEHRVIYSERDGCTQSCALMVVEIPPAVVAVCAMEPEPVEEPVDDAKKKGKKGKKGKKDKKKKGKKK